MQVDSGELPTKKKATTTKLNDGDENKVLDPMDPPLLDAGQEKEKKLRLQKKVKHLSRTFSVVDYRFDANFGFDDLVDRKVSVEMENINTKKRYIQNHDDSNQSSDDDDDDNEDDNKTGKNNSQDHSHDNNKNSQWKSSATSVTPPIGIKMKNSINLNESPKDAIMRPKSPSSPSSPLKSVFHKFMISKYGARHNAIIELLESERRYVGYMNIILRVYYKSLVFEEPILPSKWAKELFPSEFKQLIQYHTTFLQKLEDRVNKYGKEDDSDDKTLTCVGDVCSNQKQLFEIYISLVDDVKVNLQKLKQYTQQFPKLKTFLDEQKYSKETMGQDLSSLLIMIIQRVPRYLLMLKTILNHTPKKHQDYENLLHAIAIVSNYAQKQELSLKSSGYDPNYSMFSSISVAFSKLKRSLSFKN